MISNCVCTISVFLKRISQTVGNNAIRGFFKKWSSFGEKTAVHWFLKCQVAVLVSEFLSYIYLLKNVAFNFRITIIHFFANFNSMKLAIIGKLVNWGENYLYFYT